MFSPDTVSPAAKRDSLRQRVNRFLNTPQYVALICALALLSNLLSLELAVYSIYALLSIYICIWGRDILPLAPIFICCYISPSTANNPGRNEASVFSGGAGIYIGILAVLMAAACLYRVIRDRRRYLGRTYRLLPGMLLLSAAYLLSGIGSPGYGSNAPRNLLFAFLQGASLCALYLFFRGGIDQKNARRDYFAWVGFFLGCTLLCQILWTYTNPEVIVDGVIHRRHIYTGWGIHNNMGAMLAMMIPFAFYLATKYQKGWLGTVMGSAFLVGVVLSCSRNATLTGTAVYFMGIVLMLFYARNRKGNTVAALACICFVSAVVILFNRQILRLFSDLLAIGLDPNSRDSIYDEGLHLFLRYPIFGVSFFSPAYQPWAWSTSAAFSGFFPPRWHNTVVQLLASCGIVGFGTYLIHRVQTLRLFLQQPNKEKTFIACSILALLVCSLFDCHFFNLGPTLFYSMALAFAEICTPASCRSKQSS